MPPKLLINCDLGESWLLQQSGRQRKILALCDLANVCCGAHAGDRDLTRATMLEAAEAGVRVGAHPGYPDPEHFGRRSLYKVKYDLNGIAQLVAEQVALAIDAAAQAGLLLYHVKPHGALYNEAASDGDVAAAIAEGVRRVAPDVVLLGLAGSVMIDVFRANGFQVLRESFADRRYTADGLLVPRSEPDALIEDPVVAHAQIQRLASFSDTVCVHSDSPNALDLLAAI